MGLQRSENVTKGLRDVKEGGISAKKAGFGPIVGSVGTEHEEINTAGQTK